MRTLNVAIALVISGTQLSWGSLDARFASPNQSNFTVPSFASTSGQTKTIEWGCPVASEHRQEANRKVTLKTIVSECIEQVSEAAAAKPNVTGVIRTSLIAPDLTFEELADGSRIVNGTIFLQTVVALSPNAQ